MLVWLHRYDLSFSSAVKTRIALGTAHEDLLAGPFLLATANGVISYLFTCLSALSHLVAWEKVFSLLPMEDSKSDQFALNVKRCYLDKTKVCSVTTCLEV